VFFNEGWVPYHDRQNYLMEADVGVSLHVEHLETAYSFRTRILDYLWTGLPIVATAGDGFAEIIAARGIGTVVPGEDVDAVVDALADLLRDGDARQACRERAAAVAAGFRWSAVLEPLVSFCREPRHAPDGPSWPGENDPVATPGPGEAGPTGLAQDLARVVDLYRRGGARAVVGGLGRRLGPLLGRR